MQSEDRLRPGLYRVRWAGFDLRRAVCTYDADGNRVRKDVGSDATEYIYFGGQVIAEHKLNGDWSDYIYANGKRIAKADNFENGVLIQGHNDCSGCGANTWYRLNDGQAVSGYTVRTGDKLVLRQYQENARGGVGVFFQGGTHNVWGSKDQANNYTNDLPTNGSWVWRAIDLVGYENRVIDWIGLDNDGNAPFGNWAIVYSDIALVSNDGTVQAIYNGSLTPSLSLIWSGGVSQLSSGERHLQGANVAETPAVSTMFYHDDHLGTSRLMTNYFGYPVWQGTFLPYGYEFNAQTTTNRYKFTGKERDSETGLDYFGARYYGSTMGRFVSTDPIWVKADRMLDPQRLNLYAYVRNNPLKLTDPSGMDVALRTCSGSSTMTQCFKAVQDGLKKEDRSHVHLIEGNGNNGFKKGQYGITVDADYKGSAGNFSTLQRLANDHSATANIDVLNPTDSFNVRVTLSYDAKKGFGNLTMMSMTPGDPHNPNEDSFMGYTFFPPGKNSPQPFSADDMTDVVVNTSADDITVAIHHELRHVLLGDFGRMGNKAAHGLPEVDKQTKEAEKEAIKNEKEQ